MPWQFLPIPSNTFLQWIDRFARNEGKIVPAADDKLIE